MFYRMKKLLAIGLVAAVVLSTAACGQKGTVENAGPGKQQQQVVEELAPDYVYVADYVSVEGTEIYNPRFFGTDMYNLGGFYNEEEGYYRQVLERYVIRDDGTLEKQDAMTFDTGVNVNQFTVGDSGEIYMVESRMEITDEEPEDYPRENTYFLVKYDAQGNKVYETDLTNDFAKDRDWFYVQGFAADGKGRVYFYSDDAEVCIFDENGKAAGKISVPEASWINNMGTAKDGKVYVAYYKNDSMGGVTLSEIDFDNKKTGASYSYSGNMNGGMTKGVEGDFLFTDENGLYEYSFADQKQNKILTWLDCDINGNYVCGVTIDNQKKVIAVVRDWESNTTELALMQKVKADQVVKKENITIGVMYTDQQLSKQVVEFNKNTDKYHISIKKYMDESNWSDTSYTDAVAKLSNDLTSGNGPDILDVNSLTDLEGFVRKGLIEDLNPYLEKSTVLSKSDYFESILESSSFDGTLAYIPSGFYLQTLVGKKSVLGDRTSWKIPDMIELSKAYPKAELMEYASRDSILISMLTMNVGKFIDKKNGKCSFDSQDFKDILLFANTFPDSEENRDNRLTPFKLADNSLLLAEVYLSRFDDVQQYLEYFNGEEVNFIGYPTDKGNGCLLRTMDGYAINAASANKDGAWAFLEKMLARDVVDDWSFYGFSSKKSTFAAQKEKSTRIEYILDENGDPYLDENGEPVIMGQGGGWTMIGDDGEEWTFNTHPLTEEEADIVEKLLKGAVLFGYDYDEDIFKMIQEEAEGFFKGDKSAEETISVIQNRVGLYLKENMD